MRALRLTVLKAIESGIWLLTTFSSLRFLATPFYTIVKIVVHNRSDYLHCGHFARLVQIQACLVVFDVSRQRWILVLASLSALDGIVKHA